MSAHAETTAAVVGTVGTIAWLGGGRIEFAHYIGRTPVCARGQAADREVRMILPDARSDGVRAQIADSVARLDRRHESEALQWIETISEFDESEAR